MNMQEDGLDVALDRMNLNEKEKPKPTTDFDPDWLKGTSAECFLSNKNPNDDYSHPIYKTISKLNGKINNMSMLELTKCLKDLKLDTRHVNYNFILLINQDRVPNNFGHALLTEKKSTRMTV
jgi:hypothetical protein